MTEKHHDDKCAQRNCRHARHNHGPIADLGDICLRCGPARELRHSFVETPEPYGNETIERKVTDILGGEHMTNLIVGGGTPTEDYVNPVTVELYRLFAKPIIDAILYLALADGSKRDMRRVQADLLDALGIETDCGLDEHYELCCAIERAGFGSLIDKED